MADLLMVLHKDKLMKKILLVQGANLNYLGKREPEIYGTVSADELNKRLREYAEKKKIDLEIFYSNLEGEVINKIYDAADNHVQGLVMNPAGFTYAGFALKDCIKGTNLPYVEIHISNIYKRNIHSVLADAAHGVITGFGLDGYILALDAMMNILEVK